MDASAVSRGIYVPDADQDNPHSSDPAGRPSELLPRGSQEPLTGRLREVLAPYSGQDVELAGHQRLWGHSEHSGWTAGQESHQVLVLTHKLQLFSQWRGTGKTARGCHLLQWSPRA